MQHYRILIVVFMLLWSVGNIQAQADSIIAPNIFLRGIVLPTGVRYTATFVKPTDSLPMRNISVEITLPPEAQFSEMLVPQQVEYDVVRVNREGAITMIWQISRLPGENALDSYSFTLAQPLTADTEFYVEWQDEDGTQHYESFYELPPLLIATQDTGIVTLSQEGFTPAGETGVQVAGPVLPEPITLTARVLPPSFNPPPEYGDLWWCSMLEVSGLPEGTSANVIVPLRRPVAPFTPLSLFRQNPDGTWSPLEGNASVTADGQYVVYDHPGGVVATGGPLEIQPEIINAVNIQAITDAGLIPPANIPPNLTDIKDGTSNTIVVGEIPPAPPPDAITDGTSNITDGTSNTIVIAEIPPVTIVDGTSNITDGTSNTIQLPEIQLPNEITDGTSNITDGSSNTVFMGELPPTTAPETSQITDGSSNTILIGEATPTTTTSTTTINDGSSNTILIGEATPTEAATINAVTDGSSNTIIIGEATPQGSPTSQGEQVTPAASPTLVGAISDGSSNTIVIGENTATQTVPPTSTPGLSLVTASPLQGASPTSTSALGFATVTAFQTPIPTATISLPRGVVLNPTPIATRARTAEPTRTPAPDAPRVEIYTQLSIAPVQCQTGRINCVLLLRRQGGGFR